jgi:hypothetical protein
MNPNRKLKAGAALKRPQQLHSVSPLVEDAAEDEVDHFDKEQQSQEVDHHNKCPPILRDR